ncbi:MAG: rod shape-determining protein MreD [Moraxellaceae bacterium]|nr:rod shape-determining protein MreD [Moraxellaceae bacterium]
MMTKKHYNPRLISFVILISFLVACMLNVYPLTANFAKFRPMILISLLIFWNIYRPNYVGVGVAVCLGLFADLLFDTLLGQQGFSALVAIFVIRLISQYIKNLTLIHAWLIASLGLIVFQAMLWTLQVITQRMFMAEMGWSLLTSILLWPILLWVLQKFR